MVPLCHQDSYNQILLKISTLEIQSITFVSYLSHIQGTHPCYSFQLTPREDSQTLMDFPENNSDFYYIP